VENGHEPVLRDVCEAVSSAAERLRLDWMTGGSGRWYGRAAPVRRCGLIVLVDKIRRSSPGVDSLAACSMRIWRMRTGISITVSSPDRLQLEAIVGDRNAPQKHVWRAAIVLLSADGIGTNEIMRQAGTSKTCVWRWQERFAQEGVAGLLRNKTRPSRIAPLGPEVAVRVVALTLDDPPGEQRIGRPPRWPRRPASASVRCSASQKLAVACNG